MEMARVHPLQAVFMGVGAGVVGMAVAAERLKALESSPGLMTGQSVTLAGRP